MSIIWKKIKCKSNNEGTDILLEAEIVDRDYSNSTSTPSMKKAIKFAIFYKLRCANGFWGGLGF